MSTENVDLRLKKCDVIGMISPAQSRAARGWLEWSQDDLAARARVSLSTVRDFEKGRRVPITNNLNAIGRVFEQAGVWPLFTEEGAPLGISARGAGDAKERLAESDKPT